MKKILSKVERGNYLGIHFLIVFASILLLFGLILNITPANQAAATSGFSYAYGETWNTYITVGKFLYSDPPKPDTNFIVK